MRQAPLAEKGIEMTDVSRRRRPSPLELNCQLQKPAAVHTEQKWIFCSDSQT